MQFIRQYELRFGLPVTITEDWFSPARPSNDKIIEFNDFPDTYLITDHHIDFTISQIVGTGSKTNTVTIYNLSDEIVDYLKENVQAKIPLELKAGYLGDIKLIFKGTIEQFVDENHTETRKTSLSLADGGINLKEAVSSRTYSKGTPASTIVSDMLSDLGLPKAEGTNLTFSSGDTIRGSMYVTGKTSDSLWKLGKDFGFDFTVINGNAYIVPKDKSSGTLSPLISYNSGLVSSISPYVDGNGKTTGSTTKPQIKFTCLLNGDLIPTSRCKVEEENYSGTYKIIEAVHKGSYEGSEWTTEVTAELLR